ncbi:agglutinin biogenesis protein MshI [Leptothrix sp. BB-4]
MFSRSAKRQQPGWLAVAPVGELARAAHVVWPAGEMRPQLRWVGSAGWQEPAVGLGQLRREPALRGLRSVALLQREQYQLLPLDAPDVPRESWRDAVRWQLKDMVDFPVDDAGIDLLEVPADASQRGRAGLLAAVAPRTALEAIVQGGDEARMPWQAIDLPDTALRNLCTLGEDGPRGVALLWLGERHGALVITAMGELLMTRPLDLTLAQVEPTDDPAPDATAAWDRAALEILRTLDHCERLFNRVGIGRLQVCPGHATGFIAHLGGLVDLPVQPYELAAQVDIDAVPALSDPAEQARYLCAIGAALRPE